MNAIFTTARKGVHGMGTGKAGERFSSLQAERLRYSSVVGRRGPPLAFCQCGRTNATITR